MAKLFFVGLDGTEKSYRLQTHRPFTIGRDPGNDIILRDPKVSRHHAEIVFERGFFVLHDLASANGTYINAKRVRVAPLTHGAKLRMGNTYGRFSEELPTENDAENQEPFEQPLPQAGMEGAPTNQHESFSPVATQPHEKVDQTDIKKKESPAEQPAPASTQAEPPSEPLPDPSSPFSRSRYRFTSGVRAGEAVAIRGEDGEPILSYRSFASVVGIVATLVSVVVVVTGLAGVGFLLLDGRILPAVLALFLSAAFSVVIAMLVPPTRVILHEGANPALLIHQQTNVSFPVVIYSIGTPERKVIARVRRNLWSRLGRNRWEILSASDNHPVGYAIEESLSRALLRKIAGKFSRRYESNVRIRYLGKHAGWIVRRPASDGQADILDLAGDIDRRVAIALTTLILGSEP